MFMSSMFQVFLVHYNTESLTDIDRATNQPVQLMGQPTSGSSATLSRRYISEPKLPSTRGRVAYVRVGNGDVITKSTKHRQFGQAERWSRDGFQIEIK